MANSYNSWDPNSGMTQDEFLYQEIARQQMAGLGSWSGGLDPTTSMRAMASDLAKSGITSLGQLGWDPKAEKQGWTSGAWEQGGIGMDNVGAASSAGYAEDDPVWGKYGAMINKDTGKSLFSSYGERTTGNTWSGSYAGKGNTGFDLTFDEAGNPIFGTHGASSADSKEAAIGLGGGLAMFAAPFVAGAFGAGGAGAGGTAGTGAAGAGSGAFLGEGVTSGVGAWDAAAGLGTAGTGAGAGAVSAGTGGVGAGGTAAAGAGAAASNPLTQLLGSGAGGLAKTLLPLLGATGGVGPGGTAGTGSINDLIQGLLANRGSQESADYAMTHAQELRDLGAAGIAKSSPWDTSGGRAVADDQLQRVIRGDFKGDAGYNLAQNAAARTSAQQPGGMSAQSAALAALKYQNDRIQALSSPAGVQFDPSTGYRNAIAAEIAANDLGGQGLASKGFGARTQNAAIGNTANGFINWLLNQGGGTGGTAGGGTGYTGPGSINWDGTGATGGYSGPGSIGWDGTGASSYDDALFGDFGW